MYQLLEGVLRAIYGRPILCISSLKLFSVQYTCMVTQSYVSTPRNHFPCNILWPIHMYQLLKSFSAQYMVAHSHVSTPRNHFPCNIWSPIHMYQLLEVVLRAIYGRQILYINSSKSFSVQYNYDRPILCINSSKSFSVQYMVAKSYVSNPRNHFPCNIWSPNLFYQLLEIILRAIYGRPFPCINSSKAFSVHYMVAHAHVSTPRNHSPCNIWSPNPMYQLLEIILRAIYGRQILCINSSESFSVQYMVDEVYISTLANFLCAS